MGVIESLEGIAGDLTIGIADVYNNLIGSENKIVLFLIATLVLAFYCYVVLLFYRKLSKRDIFEIHLEDQHGLGKIFAALSYIVKYIILFPLYTIFWFLFLSYTLFFLGAFEFTHILFLAALVLSATRLLAYFNESAAKEIAKLLPFVFLSAVLLNPTMLEQQEFPVDEIIRQEFVPMAFFYLGVIFGLEIVLRIVYDITLLLPRKEIKQKMGIKEEKKKKKEENND